MGSRIQISMDKDWRFHLGDVERKQGISHGDIYNSSKTGARQGVPQPDFDISNWEKVDLPHDWSIHQPFDREGVADWGYKPRGTGWYRKMFYLPQDYQNKTLKLLFEGIATHATIYYNGSILYRSHSGYVPFEVDISNMSYFEDRPNVLAIYVDASEWEGWWYEGAGIYRHVNLEVRNQVHFTTDGVHVRPVKKQGTGSDCWHVDVQTQIANNSYKAQEVNVVIQFKDQQGDILFQGEGDKILCSPGAFTVANSGVDIENPVLWDVEYPHLYKVISKLYLDGKLVDHHKTVCGFRTVAMDPEKGFLLNGRPLKLFGTCNHQDFGGLGVALPDTIQAYKIMKLKEMGCNAYRSAHGMASREIIEACDHMGMLVMDENRHFESSEEELFHLRTMVSKDRNHPSVVMYSIFNEEPFQGTKQGQRIAKRMYQEIYKLDNTRIITGAMHGGILNEDSAATVVDACGINYQMDCYEEFHQKYPNIPIIATETTSAFSVRGEYETDQEQNRIASYDEDSSEWGATVRDTWKGVLDKDYVAGAFMWTGFDYLGEPTPHVWPSVSSFFGMMDTCGFPKDAYYLCQSIFLKKPVCHILPHWTHPGKEGQLIKLMSHTNCQQAELVVNGVSFGKKDVDVLKQVIWEVPYEPGYVELIGYRDGVKVAHDVKQTAGKIAGVKLKAWRKNMPSDGVSVTPVEVIAVDEKGVNVPDANNTLHFEIEGGCILGSANGDPNCHEDFDGSQRSLFHGKCMVIVKSNKDSDMIRLLVTSKGIELNVLEIPLTQPSKEIKYMESVEERFVDGWQIYRELSQEALDPQMVNEDFDQNTWEDISVADGESSCRKFAGQVGKWGLYQAIIHVDAEFDNAKTLHFYGIWGEYEIYVNGELRKQGYHEWSQEADIKLQDTDQGEILLRVLIRGNNEHGAGIVSKVVIR